VTPVSLVPREHLDEWLALSESPDEEGMSGPASDLLSAESGRRIDVPRRIFPRRRS
jgi:hypothetical protein